MFCNECGKENPDGAKFCNSCGKSFTGVPAPSAAATSKQTEVIKAKIATKEQEIKDNSQTGPAAIIFLGILLCFGFIVSLLITLLGIIFIGFGAWWSSSRQSELNKLQGELKVLQAELG